MSTIDKFGRRWSQSPLHVDRKEEEEEYVDFKHKRLTGIDDPVDIYDAVNKRHLQNYYVKLADLEEYMRVYVTKLVNEREDLVTKSFLLNVYDQSRLQSTTTFVNRIFEVMNNRISLLPPHTPVTAFLLKKVLET